MAGTAVDNEDFALPRTPAEVFEYKPVNCFEIALAVAIVLANSLPGVINPLLGLR